MNVTFWGTRGSVAAPGPETARYGGNTSCVEVRGGEGTVVVLDAGTGIRRLGAALGPEVRRIDVLITHLHMDHIQGLGFFAPLYDPSREVHLWGPPSPTLSLRQRLTRYLSPPLFPVLLRDLPCKLTIHEVPVRDVAIGEFLMSASLVCHPGPTVGYRLEAGGASLAYLPDHEPALGSARFPIGPAWTSGHDLAVGADLLIHDAQYTDAEYPDRIGWGHSSISHMLAMASQAGVKRLAAFHHDPARSDSALDRTIADAVVLAAPPFAVTAAAEGTTLRI